MKIIWVDAPAERVVFEYFFGFAKQKLGSTDAWIEYLPPWSKAFFEYEQYTYNQRDRYWLVYDNESSYYHSVRGSSLLCTPLKRCIHEINVQNDIDSATGIVIPYAAYGAPTEDQFSNTTLLDIYQELAWRNVSTIDNSGQYIPAGRRYCIGNRMECRDRTGCAVVDTQYTQKWETLTSLLTAQPIRAGPYT